ncbi:hypothetical protein PUN28_002652 [Cardiocondyla obscurior]|uniref:Uncharacterized protein n=1 Tax=Cardiocondyla obscurior TaxID=286306 RepID=A0AAW2GVD8_9HYME
MIDEVSSKNVLIDDRLLLGLIMSGLGSNKREINCCIIYRGNSTLKRLTSSISKLLLEQEEHRSRRRCDVKVNDTRIDCLRPDKTRNFPSPHRASPAITSDHIRATLRCSVTVGGGDRRSQCADQLQRFMDHLIAKSTQLRRYAGHAKSIHVVSIHRHSTGQIKVNFSHVLSSPT